VFALVFALSHFTSAVQCEFKLKRRSMQAPTPKNRKFSFFCEVACPSVCVDVAQDTWDGLCIKVGRGQGDGDIGTRVWGLGTWGRETRDLRTSSMGRRDVWDGDAGTSNTGTQGTRDVNNYCKSRR